MAMMGAILCGAVADWLQTRYNFSRLYTISVICAATFLLTVGMLYCDPPHRTGASNAGDQDQGQGSDTLFWLLVALQVACRRDAHSIAQIIRLLFGYIRSRHVLASHTSTVSRRECS